jgi:hypothetical protein
MNANELADALDWVCENHLVGIGDADFKSTATMLRQQQTEIEALKQIIDANNLSQNIGQFIKPDLKIEEVMSEHCTCYKLGYNPLNNYKKVEQK